MREDGSVDCDGDSGDGKKESIQSYFGVRADSIIEYEARGKWKSKRYLVLVTGL